MEDISGRFQVEFEDEEKLLFSINNTKQLIMMDIFWFVFFFLFVCILWILFVNLEQNIGIPWKELFLKEIYDPRFSSILVILLVVAPISTFLAVRKTLKKDNKLYFFDNQITYHDLVVNHDEIIEIKIGCCPINGNIKTQFLIYSLGGWFIAPLRVFDIFWFYFLKIIAKNNVKSFSNHFLILSDQSSKPIIGVIYYADELKKFQKYIIEKGINNGR